MAISSYSNAKVAILGASGYTGAETIRLVLSHANLDITFLTADKYAGKKIEEAFPHLSGRGLPKCIKIDDLNFEKIDVIFSCLPNNIAQNVALSLPKHIIFIDLSAAFRFKNINLYSSIYGNHLAPDLQKEAVYGLTEYARGQIKKARIIANPGCYPTSALLPLIPILENKLADTRSIIIDSKSGTTGAGRSVKENMLFSELNESINAYGVGKHRHLPEIKSILESIHKESIDITFTPHLIPMKRGIFSTIYLDGEEDLIREHLKKTYSEEFFVQILDDGVLPKSGDVVGSNVCKIGIYSGNKKNQTILLSTLDNLVKGAAGQAVQNLNVILGFKEYEGLSSAALYP